MTSERPLITILTLSYHSPDLMGCIDSILEQTYPRIQYIIVDDGTEDFDKGYVENYINEKQNGNIEELIVIKNQKNQGTVKASNIALKNAKGDIIFNLAGDDQFFDKKVIEDWVEAFQKSGAMVMTAYRMVYDQELKKKINIAPLKSEVKLIKKCGPEELFEKIAAKNIIFGCCTAQTKKAYEEYGLHDERYKLIDDHPYYLTLLRKGQKIEFFDRIVVKYRQGGVSYSKNIDKIYYKDADSIIKNEVLPYVSNPKKIQKQYKNWKKDMEWGAKVANHREKEKRYSKKKIALFFIKALFAIKNPRRAFKKIAKTITREYVKEIKSKR